MTDEFFAVAGCLSRTTGRSSAYPNPSAVCTSLFVQRCRNRNQCAWTSKATRRIDQGAKRAFEHIQHRTDFGDCCVVALPSGAEGCQ
ncbi:hypothetical protein ZHAS_00006200 [Anopheles sinensis]|uniref:Uncharacterized protein n=1 Tax=Anopheles sinensis TaxID=74873 RepID=A0A084VLP2_ANOSI|nr:hypothetical protein ZHAS_00006200 [Anopheles sinensis]